MKRTSRYSKMTASDLAQETRARGLAKPDDLTNISEWADFLEGEDAKTAQAEQQPAARIGSFTPPPDYEAMSKTEALKRAQEAGMPVSAKSSKVEAIEWLLASQGVTEDEQAAPTSLRARDTAQEGG